MPITTNIDRARGYVVQTIQGEVRVAEVVEAQRGLYLNPEHDASLPVLFDSRHATASPRTAEEMQRMVDQSRTLWARMGTGRTAILVGSTVDVGMAHMYQTFASRMPRQIEVFTDHEEAVAWLLGLPRDELDPSRLVPLFDALSDDEDTAELPTLG